MHESAPDDPSVPLQRAYTSPPSSPAPKPFASRTRFDQQQPATSPSQPPKQAAASSPAAENSADVRPGEKDTAGSAAGTATAGSGVISAKRRPKCVRLAGLRQLQEQVLGDQELQKSMQQGIAGSLEAGDSGTVGTGDVIIPRLWYLKKDVAEVLLSKHDTEQQSLPQIQSCQHHREESPVAEGCASDSGTDPNRNSEQAPTHPLLDMDRQTDGQTGQQRLAEAGSSCTTKASAGDQTAASVAAPSYLPSIDLLAQFGKRETRVPEAAASTPSDPELQNTSEDTLAKKDDFWASATDMGSDRVHEPDRKTNDVTVHLDGAQVLTPDGWQPVTRPNEPGTAWEDGKCMTIGTTLAYKICASTGQIVAVTCGWATIDAYAWTIQDALDIYIKCAGLDDL